MGGNSTTMQKALVGVVCAKEQIQAEGLPKQMSPHLRY